MKNRIILLFFAFYFHSYAFSQIGGSATYDFLNIPVPARVAALGGNLICVKDGDINLSLQNPSLLDSTVDRNLALNYVNYFTDINYGYAVYGRHFKNIGTFSAGLHYMSYGKFVEADPDGAITGEFKAGEYSVNLGYGRQIDTSFSIGANLKTIYSALGSNYSSASVVDFAGTYNNTKRKITIAGVIKNIGVQWKPYVKGNREPLPFEIQLGISKKLKHAPFRFSLIAQNLEKWDLTYEDPLDPSIIVDPLTKEVKQKSKPQLFTDKLMRHIVLGTEFLITKNFNLRVGYNYQRRKELHLESAPGMVGFSFGFGFKISKLQISYGRAIYHLAGPANHFSVSTNLSNFYSKK